MVNDLDDYLVSPEAVRQTASAEGRLLKPGEVFDGMRVVAFLGKGASSEVWRMRDEALHADCALKMFAAADPPSLRERFLAEARLLAQFNHPNIVHVRRLSETGEHPYFTMDLLRPLSAMPSGMAAAKILDGVLSGLAALHAKGILHRDIKPDNVLLDGTGNAILADLGAAHIYHAALAGEVQSAAVHNLTLECGRTAAIGTPGFGAPEQFFGGDVSPATDIHALGVFIDSLFGGKVPFLWRGIVRRMTSAVPKLRYQSIAEVRRALSNVRMLKWLLHGVAVAAVVALACVSIRLFAPKDWRAVAVWKDVSLDDFSKTHLRGKVPPYSATTVTNSTYTITLQDGGYYLMNDAAATDARYFHDLYDPRHGTYSRIAHFVIKGSGMFRWPKVKACHVRICDGVTFITSGKCDRDMIAKTEVPPPDARTDDGINHHARYAAYTVEKGGKLIFENGLKYPEGLIERK